eukprot:5363065-Prymnesium_polylepis.1
MSIEHARHHPRQRDIWLKVEVIQSAFRIERIGPQLCELGHILVELHLDLEVGHVLPDLVKELVGREREAGDVVQALGFAELSLSRVLERDEASHEVVDKDHRKRHVGIDGALVRLASRCGEQRVESVLRCAVSPHWLAV